MQQTSYRRLFRSEKDRMLAGVCGGIADFLRVDPSIIRLLWVLFTLAGGSGVLVYIILWIILPNESEVVKSD